ncbi:hypothetical protein ACS386_04810 [Flavobacteriaceae bacterium LMO-SS05]
MKTFEKKSSSFILLFWSIPSCSMLKAYKLKSDLLVKAANESRAVKLLTNEKRTLKLKKVEIDSGQFFGLKSIKGQIAKILLNLNDINMVTLL